LGDAGIRTEDQKLIFFLPLFANNKSEQKCFAVVTQCDKPQIKDCCDLTLLKVGDRSETNNYSGLEKKI
jgi:hypothetical protein